MDTVTTPSIYSQFKKNYLGVRFIRVRGEYEAFHAYENAPDEVAFLKNRHRHIFKWEALIEVFHDDRELEFFMVKWALEQKVIPYIKLQSNVGSCEQQAERILEGLVNLYGAKRGYWVEVSEDGENGGGVIWDPYS